MADRVAKVEKTHKSWVGKVRLLPRKLVKSLIAQKKRQTSK
jgi:hypothetical protein